MVRRAAPDRQGLPAPHQRARVLSTRDASSSPAPRSRPCPPLEAVAASRHELVGVVTRPDAPAGRGRRLVASPVAAARRGARRAGAQARAPARPGVPGRAARRWRPDCCPVVAYGALLPRRALDIPPHGWVNLHFSLLPAWRGAAPVQHALWAGDEVTGATTFRIVPALDAGPTFGVMTERVRPTDTAGDLLGPARRGRRRAAGAHPRRHRGRHAGGPRAADDGCQPGPQGRGRGRPGRLVPAGRRRRPAGPGLHPRARAPGRRTTGSGSSSARCALEPDARPARAGRARGRPRTRCTSAPARAGAARRREAVRQEADAAADWARGARLETGARFG